MIAQLIIHILQVDATTGTSANLLDSAGTGQPVHHQRTPQGSERQAVVFDVLSQTPDYCKGGMALQEYTVSFAIHHENDAEADTIADNLISLVEGWKGEHGGKTWHYTVFQRKTDLYTDSQEMPAKVVDFLFSRQN